MQSSGVLLLVLLAGCPWPGHCRAARQSRKDVTRLGPEGRNCPQGSRLVCHGDVRNKITSKLMNICNNGKIEKMTTPFNFQSPRGKLPQCEYEGKKYCHGDDVTDFSVWFLEHRCELGTVIYRNLITGLEMVTDQILLKRSKLADSSAGDTNEI